MFSVSIRGVGVLALALVFQATLVNAANAYKVRFGANEELHVIAPTGLVNDGRALSLCYKAYTFFLLAGVYTTDELVLCDGSKHYRRLPPSDKIAQLQNANLLPKPLPTYERPTVDYVIGYGLWVIVPFVAFFTFLSTRREKAGAQANGALLRVTVRRIMARMVGCSTNRDRTINLAAATYLRMFNEPLRQDEFSADFAFVRNEPAAYDGFMGAMGRKLPKPLKLNLLRLATALVMVSGDLQPSEQAAVAHLAHRLNISPKDNEAIALSLRRRGPSTEPMLA
jgi:hypothetical protein